MGVTVAVALVAVRIPLADAAGDRVPYALNFLAVVLAALLAGWRSGLVAMLAGQVLTWYAIVPPHDSIDGANSGRLAGLLIASISQILILLVIALYQREVDKGTAERERRMELLHHALREIDHRTSNNYQTVLALIHLQAQRSKSAELQDALTQASDRIGAIAKASEQLAFRSATLESVRLDEHLCELCDHIGRGLSRDEIDVDCKISPCSADPDRAIAISIIVNELVTNALKHAFGDRPTGRVRVVGKTNGGGFELTIADDGIGMKRATSRGRGGLGTKLVETYVGQLGARHEVVSSETGTTHRLVIPNLE
jgi:two-component sensor histidine kinase